MTPDITTRADIEIVVEDFYLKVFHDDTIGHFFTEVVPLNLETHIPLITDFWESVVFGKRGYGKDVLQVHRNIHHQSAIKKEHLDRWIKEFTDTVDRHFKGDNAELMKQRARSIATLMDLKLNHSNKLS